MAGAGAVGARAALQAAALRRLLAAGGPPQPRRHFRALARVVGAPWDVAATADLAHPTVLGRRTAKVRQPLDRP